MENPISNESIGKRVAALRKKQHLTQAQLADLVGATAKHISEIEQKRLMQIMKQFQIA